MAKKGKTNAKVKAPRKMGRPTSYSEALTEKICLRLIDGESLRSIARDPQMPAMSTIWKWTQEHPEFSKRYADARALQAELLMDDIEDIANDSSRDMKTVVNAAGHEVEVVDQEHIQRSRLRVDTLKFKIVKFAPKRYGEKLDVDANVKLQVGIADLVARRRENTGHGGNA